VIVVLFVVLFLIGAGITSNTLKEIGVRPLIQGVTLWIVAASLSHGPSIWDGPRYKASPCYWLQSAPSEFCERSKSFGAA
jgi:hypothetical protein